ncbi:cyclic lactone autoinducer peptide [Petroclostridium sp. X23]|nr:cyclic lactone autoinducer peptide [Petroclostridium sp. X23]WHH59195.1 cyclic lactone autoinducer peptide [Petroclostridium sp. X23]
MKLFYKILGLSTTLTVTVMLFATVVSNACTGGWHQPQKPDCL